MLRIKAESDFWAPFATETPCEQAAEGLLKAPREPRSRRRMGVVDAWALADAVGHRAWKEPHMPRRAADLGPSLGPGNACPPKC